MHGHEAYHSIRDKVLDVERQLQGVRTGLRDAERAISVSTAEREAAYGRLTEIYLPDLGQETVERIRQRLPALHREVAAIFEAKHEKQEQVSTALAAREKTRKELDEKLDSVTEGVEKKVKERERLQALVDEELAESAQYQERLQASEVAGERLQQIANRLETAVADRDEKIPAYENDRLFKYLLDRGYGTHADRAGGLIGRLDSWVAGLVDYREQKHNYDHLRWVPDLLEKEVAKLTEEFEKKVGAQQEMENEAAERHGLDEVIREGEKLYDERTVLLSQLSTLDASVADLVNRRKELSNSRDAHYEQALGACKEYLEDADLERLRELALSTETKSDDGLTARIGEIESDLDRAQDRLRRLRKEDDDIEDGLRGLREIQRDSSRNDYDSRRSRFDDELDIGALLLEFLAGSLNVGGVRRRLKKKQWFKPTSRSSRPFGRSRGGGIGADDVSSVVGHILGGLSSSGGGGGRSGGGFSTGGGFGGGSGGFKTGGGF